MQISTQQIYSKGTVKMKTESIKTKVHSKHGLALHYVSLTAM